MKFKKIGIVTKPDLATSAGLEEILVILKNANIELYAEEHAKKIFPEAKVVSSLNDVPLDLLFVIGGDGTILRATRDYKHSVPILSVHQGTVGFLTEMTFKEVSTLLQKFLDGEGHIEERHVLQVQALRGKESFFSGEVLNEAVISQGSIARLVDLRCEVNGEDLTTFRSDGLILSSPTGSTAYSLAAGGPIVHPRLSAIVLTPINSHSFTQKPIVLPGDVTVLTEILSKEREFKAVQVSLTLDGQQYIVLQRGDMVIVKMSNRTVKFLRRKEETFLQTLRKKLKWGERVSA
jgi:NAD+ kinase